MPFPVRACSPSPDTLFVFKLNKTLDLKEFYRVALKECCRSQYYVPDPAHSLSLELPAGVNFTTWPLPSDLSIST